MNADIEILRNFPTVDQVNEILLKSLESKSGPSFQLINALLNYTIPQIYPSLESNIRSNLINVFQSLIGIGNLVGAIASLKDQTERSKELKSFIDVLQMVVNEKLILQLVNNQTTSLEIKEIDKLIFKGRLFSIINEVTISNNLEINNDHLKSTEKYIDFLCNSLLTLHQNDVAIIKINIFMVSILKFGDDSCTRFFEQFMTRNHWRYFIDSYKGLKKFQQREYIKKLFTIYLNGTILRGTAAADDAKLLGLYDILSFVSECLDESIIEVVLLCGNKNLNKLMSLLVTRLDESRLDSVTMKILSTWGDENLIKKEPIAIQESRTHILLQILSQRKNTLFLKNLLKDPVFLNSITNRLSSFSNNVKALGVTLADYVCQLNGEEKIFKLTGDLDLYSHLLEGSIEIIQISTDPWDMIVTPHVEEVKEIETRLELVTIDSDDESDSEDDPSLPSKVKIPAPVYIKDLLRYITVDTKDKNAYEMRRTALLKGPTLLRQKAGVGNEVSFHSEDLITHLIALNNHYNDSDFESLKLNNMVATIVTNPNITFYMFNLLLTGDYSLQQRMIILSATSLAARELRGLKDDVITKSFTPKSFPTKMLPPALHQKYLNMEVGTKYIDTIQHNLQDSLMHEESSKAQDTILGNGKLVRISAKLKKEQAGIVSTNDHPIIPNFYQLVGRNFFFPLLNVWYEAEGIDIGHYTPVFVAHYIKTLTLLIHCAYPSSIQLKDMIREFLVLSKTIIAKVSLSELQVIESVVTGLLLIFDITDKEYLILNHNKEILFFRDWLHISWEQVIDSKIKSLCAGLLLKIQDLTQSFERTIMDQMNSIY
ncbi:TEL2 [[Candida] subhashii]|uniref:TEL2 n=1 Tax=[Candida] subhashii TaxID=561895 RepID=A0A8J5QQ45_9ASCO|nr:TEL2 [[Candida] subhashii]KAG7664388.1 TEL2 [[Candida] subhashii]